MIDDLTSYKILDLEETEESNPRLVVRVRTSYWHDEKGIYSAKRIHYLKRLTDGFNFLREDAHMIGADETVPRIINFHEVEDGIYEVITCNHTRDWETGSIEDYDFKLIPYEKKT